jgi:hypothetical protein
MITSSIQPAIAPKRIHKAPARTRTTRSGSTAPEFRAGETPIQRIFLGVDRPSPDQRSQRVDDRHDRDHGSGIGTEPLAGMRRRDMSVVVEAAATAGDGEDASSVRRVDLALLGIAVVVMTAFVWMIAGNDDLSSPFRVATSWLWHVVETSVIAVMAYGAWQLVRSTPWTVRIVAVGILILNWILTAWLG